MILVCYDGSADADAAIDRAAQLTPGAEAAVLTIWEPFVNAMLRNGSMGMGVGLAGSYADGPVIDQASERAATETAGKGAARAMAAGLHAKPVVAVRHGGLARTILHEADELEVDAIVLGTRGRGDVKSFLLGSTSHEVLQHAARAVVVVPSAERACQRAGSLSRGESRAAA